MATFQRGDMFDTPGVHIVTGNSFISGDGTLVMSMGGALDMKTRFPDLPRIFGTMVGGFCGHLGKYGLLIYGSNGILQTRRDIQGKMDADLIRYGLKLLSTMAEGNPSIIFHLTHPGLSLHKMSIPEIDRLLQHLPDTVWVWQRS